MRERRRGDADPDVRVGITPARAGKTSSRSLHRPANRDHPRSCGKDTSCGSNNCPNPGSPRSCGKDEKYNPAIRPGEGSPRSCGKDFCMCSASILNTGSPPLVRERLLVFGACAAMHRDHPRSCGKDASKRLTEASAAGSPPLVRERLVFDRFHVDVYGITPARAGKTNIYHIRGDTDRDHPRSCGKDIKWRASLSAR